jgi:dTMP kinase
MALLISFEGPDGSGKSTQARLLADVLQARGHRVTLTREPGGTPVGEQIRRILLDPETASPNPLVMALLLSASRAQLVSDVIAPALRRGDIVIVDRYTDSTVAYQGYGQALDKGIIRELNEVATQGILPDVTIYVDVPVEVGLDRVRSRGKRNRLDVETVAFHRRVREGYLAMIAEGPPRWFPINGNAPTESVHATILQSLEPILEKEVSVP